MIAPAVGTLTSLLLLAQDGSTSLYFWIGVLLVVVVLLFGAVVWTRRRLSPNEDFHGEGFTLTDLRQLHKDGKLTDEEFERAKAKMVEALHATQMRKDAAKAEAAKQVGQQHLK